MHRVLNVQLLDIGIPHKIPTFKLPKPYKFDKAQLKVVSKHKSWVPYVVQLQDDITQALENNDIQTAFGNVHSQLEAGMNYIAGREFSLKPKTFRGPNKRGVTTIQVKKRIVAPQHFFHCYRKPR